MFYVLVANFITQTFLKFGTLDPLSAFNFLKSGHDEIVTRGVGGVTVSRTI